MSMHRLTPLLSLGLALAITHAGIATAQEEHHHQGGGKPIGWAKLHDAQGAEAGTVKLFATPDGSVRGIADVTGATPGEHGIHLHTTGKCEGPAFTSAGGHLNPDGKQHGLQNPQGAHQGDLPNITIGADGKGHATFTAKTTEAALFDADGTSVVVHAAADDNKTDPSGNSGARLLCGVLEKPAPRAAK